MTTSNFTDQIARAASQPIAADPAVSDRLRLLLFDYLAIVRAGAASESSAAVHRAIAAEGGSGSSLVDGTDRWESAQQAALANGTSAHSLELDDTHEPSSTHPGVALWPALIALADQENVTVRRLLDAAIVGYDIIAAAGTLLGASESYERGFHPTGVVGAVGAAAACAHLLGLDERHTRDSVAIAAGLAAGSLEFLSDGSWTKRLNAGAAAATGVRAARLGQAGFVAPATAIEGRDGWLRLYGHGASGRTFDHGVGSGVLGTSFKLYACCRYMHGAIDLLREVHAERPGLLPEDVESVDIAVIEAGQSLVSSPPARKVIIETPVDAQFSMPFGAAVALTRGRPRLRDFDEAPAVASDLRDWLPKMRSYTSPVVEAAFPDSWQAEVTVRFASGEILERRCSAFRGSPALPPSWDDLIEKESELIGGESARRLRDEILALGPDMTWHHVADRLRKASAPA